MKVLGISFGRKNGNTDILVKEALFGAKELGAEIEFINTNGKLIKPCVGCFACSGGREKGGNADCIIKDDLPFIDNAIMEADAVVIGAPVYSVGPTGQLKCMIDRMGLGHDRAFSDFFNKKRSEEGKPLLDERLFKDRYLGLISVGGATEENWTAMGLPNMHLFSFSMQMPVIDHVNAFDLNICVSPVLNEKLIERVNRLGKNVTEAIGSPDKYKVEWKGDMPGICPMCHNDILQIKEGVKVECPVCGIKGELSIVNGEIKADFPEEQFPHSRMRYGGVLDHFNELSTIGERIPDEIKGKIGLIDERLEKYKEIKSVL